MSKGIAYTRGTVQHLAQSYYTLVLYEFEKKVYSATISKEAAMTWAAKSKISFIKKEFAVKQQL